MYMRSQNSAEALTIPLPFSTLCWVTLKGPYIIFTMPALPPKACICPAFPSKQNLSPCWVRRSSGESILDCSSILNAFQLFPSNSIQTPWLGRESSFQTFTPAWGWGVRRTWQRTRILTWWATSWSRCTEEQAEPGLPQSRARSHWCSATSERSQPRCP